MPDSLNSFGSRAALDVNGTSYDYFRLDAVPGSERLPFSLKVLFENVLRTEDGENITADQVNALANWDPAAEPDIEIQFSPARVVMQDFTGVPAVVDLATMREAVKELGGDPAKINPLAPAELVIDHSVIADLFGTPDSFARNVELEYERNVERYQFLRWGQTAFDEFKVVPPGTGIVHQVNIEYLARVIFARNGLAYPDTLVGTDSHTTMVNGLGVLGWGVGGIEAEAAMLGQPVSMLIPRVVGFKLTGELPDGSTATDLVLTITEMLRNWREAAQPDGPDRAAGCCLAAIEETIRPIVNGRHRRGAGEAHRRHPQGQTRHQGRPGGGRVGHARGVRQETREPARAEQGHGSSRPGRGQDRCDMQLLSEAYDREGAEREESLLLRDALSELTVVSAGMLTHPANLRARLNLSVRDAGAAITPKEQQDYAEKSIEWLSKLARAARRLRGQARGQRAAEHPANRQVEREGPTRGHRRRRPTLRRLAPKRAGGGGVLHGA